MILPRPIVRAEKAASLTPAARKAFFRAYGIRMDTPVIHPLFDYRVSYRRLLEIQTRSLARGECGPDSDYDLLVVVPDDVPLERKKSGLAYQALWGTGTAADVIVWQKTAFERRSRVICSLPGTVLREGKVLYAA